MDVITQQMKSVALSGNANESDANNFNEGLFKYLLFVANNAGMMENIWSEPDKNLKAWMRKQNKEFLRLMICQTSNKMMVLNHVNLPWRLPQEVKWNQRYEELVKYRSIHNNCNVPCNVPHLGEWVNNQRQFKKIDAAGKKSSLTIKRLKSSTLFGLIGTCVLERKRGRS
jgi:hypothetical protein